MRILALDLGRHVGVAVGEPGAPPTLSSLDLDATIGPAMSRFEGYLRGALRNHRVDFLVFEAPMLPFGSKARMGIVNHLYRQFGQASAIWKLAFEHGVPAAPFQVRSVRKQICGSAKANPETILRACYAIGATPANDHEADACLIWRAAMNAVPKREAA